MPEPEILNVAPEEAIAHFRAKGFHIGFDWQDTNALEHARSFTVSKVMQFDILADVREAVAAALTEGRTFAWFRDNLEPTLRNKGWWGRETLTDPLTGETRTVQLGSPWRLRTIFDTNLRMSYAHGRWQTHRTGEGEAALPSLCRGPRRTHPPRARRLARRRAPRRPSLVEDALPAQRLQVPLPGAAALRGLARALRLRALA